MVKKNARASAARPPLAFQRTRRVILLLLLGWFLGQCGNSLRKLMAGSIGTAEGMGHDKEVLYPSVTMCPVTMPINETHYPEQNDISEVYDSWVGLPQKQLLRLLHTFVTRNEVAEASEGESYSALIEGGFISQLTMGWHVLERCVTYNPPEKSKPGIAGRLSMMLNATGLERWMLVVHNKDMIYPTLSQAFGSMHVSMFPRSLDDNGETLVHSEYTYEIKRTKWSLVSTAQNPCSPTVTQRMDTCIEEHFERTHGCTLPWTKSENTGQPCPYKDVLKHYEGLIDTGMQDVSIGMGCLPSCEYTEYEVRHITTTDEISPRFGSNDVNALLLLTSGNYKIKEQYFLYELSDFISDIGGYLGLLLGQSLLTCCDIILGWMQVKQAKKNQRNMVDRK